MWSCESRSDAHRDVVLLRGIDGLEAYVHMRNASCTAAMALATSVWVSLFRWRMRWVVVTRSRTDG